MPVVFIVLQIAILLLLPRGLMWLSRRLRIEKILGDVVLCYVVGMLFANTQWLVLPAGAVQEQLFATSKTTVEISVLLAIPMLLISMHLASWLRYTGKLLQAFLLGTFCMMLNGLVVSYAYRDIVPQHAEATAMLVAVYTGGTPNMAAVGKVVDPSGTLFGILNAVEMFWGGLYFLFLTGLAPILYKKLLPPFRSRQSPQPENQDYIAEAQPHRTLPWNAARLRALAVGLGAAVLVVALSVGLALLLPNHEGKLNEPVLMLALTSLGIGASLIRYLREQKGVYEFAQYLLLIFGLAAGSIADFSQVAQFGLDFVAIAVLCLVPGVLLHLLVCRLLGIDRDTHIIASAANIFGPPFIGQVASALNNKEIIAGGIAMGSLGLALGNYVGLLVAKLGLLF